MVGCTDVFSAVFMLCWFDVIRNLWFGFEVEVVVASIWVIVAVAG